MIIDHRCFFVALVLAGMNTCASCQTAAPVPKPLASCEALEQRMFMLQNRIEKLEAQVTLDQITVRDNMSPACLPEDRD